MNQADALGTKEFFRLNSARWPNLPGQSWADFSSATKSPLRPGLMFSKSKLQESAQAWRQYLQSARPAQENASASSSQLRCLYSVKAQPELAVLKSLAQVVDGFDVSSRHELELIHREFPKHFISYTGPGKTDDDLRFASGAADLIHLESREEAWACRSLAEFAVGKNRRAKLSLRLCLAPDSKLGLSEVEIEELIQTDDQLRLMQQIVGAHWYLGREAYSAKTFEEAWLRNQASLQRLLSVTKLTSLELSIGLGLPSFGKTWDQLRLPTNLPVSTWNFEAGRCVVQDAALYWAPIVAVKQRQERVVIIEGGTQHLSGILSPVYGSQGLRVQAWRDGQAVNSTELVRTQVYGSLCMAQDRVGPPVDLPRDLRAGDWLGFSSVGAYNLSASAVEFISRPRPVIWMMP
ncbi:MAG TPA: hypothetical protein PLZ57_04215 [Pseudobdellovibrionaceae bacterium]|nr:hypothetical protein [Pseudobdellovibrionaceae bacterium]